MTKGDVGLRRLSRVGLGLCVVGLGGVLPATAAALTYSAPGEHILAVPSGVTAIRIDAAGAGGGLGASDTGCTPGKGGSVSGTFSVTPGSTVLIWVGGKGGNGVSSSGGYGYGGQGGFDGGGSGGTAYETFNYNAGGGGGGGASEVKIAGGSMLLVAGGGGGCGGVADNRTQRLGDGGNDGSPGVSGEVATGGGAGTQSAPGEGGQSALSQSPATPPDGSPGSGMNGGSGATSYLFPAAGGGGGGGYYGGGGGGGSGGAGSSGGGGGGSDYVDPTGSNTAIAHGTTAGDGAVTIECASGTGTASDPGGGPSVLAGRTTTTGRCPLNVTITPKSKVVGLSTESGIIPPGSPGEPATFGAVIPLVVRVTDWANQPVRNANVTVVLGHTSGMPAPYPSGTNADQGHICTAFRTGGGCSDNVLTGLAALKTDANGQAFVDYDAPGLLTAGAASVAANATASICGASCSEAAGQSKPVTLKVRPRQLGEDRLGSLSYAETLAIVDHVSPINWASLTKGLTLEKLEDEAKEGALKLLLSKEVVEESIIPGLGNALTLKKILLDEPMAEERELMAEVLDAFDLVDSGLGADLAGLPWSSNYASPPFLDAFTGRRVVATNGMIWRLGQKLETLFKIGQLGGSLQLHLKLFEVSFCSPSVYCETGDWSLGDKTLHPYVDFQFSVDRGYLVGTVKHYIQIFHDNLVQPYDPAIWTPANKLR